MNDYIGVSLGFAPMALLGWFFVWDGGTAQDDATQELARTPLRRWRHSAAISEADAVAASRYRIRRMTLWLVGAGWPMAMVFVYFAHVGCSLLKSKTRARPAVRSRSLRRHGVSIGQHPSDTD